MNLSGQKELDVDPKAIRNIEFIGQLEKLNNDNINFESIFILMILEKLKETRLKSHKEV